MNVEKQVAHWLNSAKEDWEVACQLLETGKTQHGLFFVHLTIEKALKAIYTKRLAQVPPKIHRLEKLALMCGISLDTEQIRILGDVNAFNIVGRYADEDAVKTSEEFARELHKQAGIIYQWLIKQL